MRFVADTGPILHLHEAGALHILPQLGEVILPSLVVAELRLAAPTLWTMALPAWVKLQFPTPVAARRAQAWQQAGLLHGGEAEAYGLGQRRAA